MNSRKNKLLLIGIVLGMVLCYNRSVESKMKFVYKLQVTDYRGNRWVDYTVVDPPTYISYNGGRSIIKQVRVLDYWCIETEESLYGKSVEKIERLVPKRPSLIGNQQITERLNRRVNSPASSQAELRNRTSPQLRQAAQGARPFVKISPPEASLITGQFASDTPRRQVVPRQHANPPSAPLNRLDSRILRRLRPYNRWIIQAAQRHRIDPDLLKALVYVESAGDSQAQSTRFAMGLAQLIPQTAHEVGVRDVFDPQQSLFGGAKYLRQQLQTFGNAATALAAYNAGPNRIRRGSLPLETRDYVKKVLTVKNLLRHQ